MELGEKYTKSESPPPVPKEVMRKTEELEISLEQLINQKLKSIEKESSIEDLETLGEAELIETASSLGLGNEDIETAKENVGFKEQKIGLLGKLKDAAGGAMEKLKSFLSLTEAAEEKKEKSLEKESEIEILKQESRDLDLTQTRIVKEQLKKLQDLQKQGKISPEEYKKRRAELAENKKFQHLVRMEQSIRDAEAFILQNPDSSKEDILKAVLENPENEKKLNAIQKKSVERAIDKYAASRIAMLEYVKSLPVGIGKSNFKNPLEILEKNPLAKKQLLEDLGFAKEHNITPDDVIVRTDFPVAIGLEFKDPNKMLAVQGEKHVQAMIDVGKTGEDLLGLFLIRRFSKKHIGKKAELSKALDDAVYLLNGAVGEEGKHTKTHELQHHIFNRFIKPEKAKTDTRPPSADRTLMEDNAIDELSAYLKTNVYTAKPSSIFGAWEKKFKELDETDPLVQAFLNIKYEFRRLDASGIKAKDIYTLVETSENLEELAKRLSLIPTSEFDSGRLAKILGEGDLETGMENVLWLLSLAENGDKKIDFTDELIEKISDRILLTYGADSDKPTLKDLSMLQTLALHIEKISGKKAKYIELAIESMKDKLKK